MGFCSKCGKEMSDGTVFCGGCGTKTGENVKEYSQQNIQNNQTSSQVEKISLWQGYISAWKNNGKYKRRASRKEYWGFYLFNMIIMYGLMVVDFLIGTGEIVAGHPLLYSLYSLPASFLGIIITISRLHDIGKSGWNILWCLTGIGAIPVFIWLLTDSATGENKYGASPKGNDYVQKPMSGGLKAGIWIAFVLCFILMVAGFAVIGQQMVTGLNENTQNTQQTTNTTTNQNSVVGVYQGMDWGNGPIYKIIDSNTGEMKSFSSRSDMLAEGAEGFSLSGGEIVKFALDAKNEVVEIIGL